MNERRDGGIVRNVGPRVRVLARVATLAVATLVATPVAAAQESRTPTETASPKMFFGIRAEKFGKTSLEDGHFAYDVPGGGGVEDAAVLVNYLDRPLTLHVYGADAIAARGGALAPKQREAKMEGVGAWFSLLHDDQASVELPPKGRVSVPFTIAVPEGTPPGDYPGAVVASTMAGRTSNGLSIETRAALLVRLRVIGKTDLRANVGDLRATRSPGGYRFDVEVRNRGNVLFTMQGYVELRRGGRRIGLMPLIPRDIYVIPEGKAELRGVWKDPPKLGRVKAIARIKLAINRKPSGTFSSPPKTMTLVPLLIGAILLGVMALTAGIWFRTRGRRQVRRIRRREEREVIRRHWQSEGATQGTQAPIVHPEPSRLNGH